MQKDMYHLRLFAVVYLFIVSHGSEDLYKILGVKKSSTKKEIKAAYKKLAMEWHPDRNDDPNANDRFMKINEAYETLSDPEKKEEYDRFGKTSSTNDPNSAHQFRRGFGGSPFASFFNFDFGAGGGVNDDLIDKFNINYNYYKSKVVPESKHKPYLIYVYADFCMRCIQVDKIFDKIVNDMENIGMGIATVRANIAGTLVQQLRIRSVPTVLVVIDGRPKTMSTMLSVPNIRDFVRSVIPKNVVQEVTDDNYEDFLAGWQDNKVRMLFCDSKYDPSLRYLLPAFARKPRFVAGYVDTKDGRTKQLLAKFRIQENMETFLLFNEDVQHPVAQVGMKVIPRSTIDELMDTNKHLLLPRLSSQELLDELCPAYSSVKRKSLCVVLLTQDTPAHNPHRESLRSYAHRHRGDNDRVTYTYVYYDTQSHFVDKLTNGESVTNETSGGLKLAIMWRKDPVVIHYDWLDGGWCADGPKLEDAHAQLGLLVSGWLDSKLALPFLTTLHSELYNEHGYPLLYRIYVRLWDWYDRAFDWWYSIDEVTVVMIVTSVMCLGLVYVMLRNVLDVNDRARPRPRRQQQREPFQQQQYRQQYEKPVVNITPLVAHNFEELVMRQERGVRVLVLFVDDNAKMKLIKQFATAVAPFARSKAFKFAFLQLEDYLPWFKAVLEKTIDDRSRDLSLINLRNCLGTVLALNGPRKSYCMYHAHTERQNARLEGFLGFDNSDESGSEDEHAQTLFESDLLFRLGSWLERLCEGNVKKFKIEEWPSME